MTDLTSDPIDEARKILPAWFIPRMMGDSWFFGIMLSDGSILGISSIMEVHTDKSGRIWLDVEMLDRVPGECEGLNIRLAPTSRMSAIIAADHVIAAMELAST